MTETSPSLGGLHLVRTSNAIARLTAAIVTVTMSFLASLALCRRRPRRWAPWIVSGTGLVVGLTRPEGNLVVVVGLVTLALVETSSPRSLLKSTIILYAAPGLAYFLWRYS